MFPIAPQPINSTVTILGAGFAGISVMEGLTEPEPRVSAVACQHTGERATSSEVGPQPCGTRSSAVLPASLDHDAMLGLYEWLNRRRGSLFGTLRECDQQDAVEETFLQTIAFAPKMRNPSGLRSACLTIGLRVRAKRIQDYIHERMGAAAVDPIVLWSPEKHLHERRRRQRAFTAIKQLRPHEREIIRRFYFEEQSADQIRIEMQLTDTQFRLGKARAIKKAAARTQPIDQTKRSSTSTSRV